MTTSESEQHSDLWLAHDAYETHGSYRKAGEVLGVHASTVMRRRREYLALRGAGREAGKTVQFLHPLPTHARTQTAEPNPPRPAQSLVDFCRTPHERQAFENGDLSPSALRTLKARAASKGWAPEAGYTHTVPAPFLVKGVSQMRSPTKGLVLEWVKSAIDPQAYEEALRAGIEELLRGAPSKPSAPFAAVECDEDLLVEFEIGDAHVNMLAWAKETGQADWDLSIACKTHLEAFGNLVARAPFAGIAHIVNFGDWFHASNHAGTSKSGNRLDTDSRLPKAYAAGVRLAVEMIEMALTKYARVEWFGVRGNHDYELAYAHASTVAAWFRDDPRVTVHLPEGAILHSVFGRNLLVYVHGEGAKGVDLPRVVANDFREQWGRTDFTFIKHGHIHSKNGWISIGREQAGAMVESMPNIPPNDAWHAENKWRSGRAMQADVLHRTKGRLERLEYHIPPRTE